MGTTGKGVVVGAHMDVQPADGTGGLAAGIAGRQPHVIDRELSAVLQDNYSWTDERRGRGAAASQPPEGWTRIDDAELRQAGINPALLHDTRSGFGANFYRGPQDHVVIAFTGSDEGRDWRHNLGQGLGLRDAQYDQAIELAGEARRAFGPDLVLTGHSLGGGLAAAAAMVHEVPAVTFNAAGVHDRTLERLGFDADVLKHEAAQGLVRSYAVQSELLTHLQEDSVLLRYVMPDAPGHRIELPDPDPVGFFGRMVPGRMLMHRVDLHYIDAVMEAQDRAGLEVRHFPAADAPAGAMLVPASDRLDALFSGQVDASVRASWDSSVSSLREPLLSHAPEQWQAPEGQAMGR